MFVASPRRRRNEPTRCLDVCKTSVSASPADWPEVARKSLFRIQGYRIEFASQWCTMITGTRSIARGRREAINWKVNVIRIRRIRSWETNESWQTSKPWHKPDTVSGNSSRGRKSLFLKFPYTACFSGLIILLFTVRAGITLFKLQLDAIKKERMRDEKRKYSSFFGTSNMLSSEDGWFCVIPLPYNRSPETKGACRGRTRKTRLVRGLEFIVW